MTRNQRFWLTAPVTIPITLVVVLGVLAAHVAERTINSLMRSGP